MTPFKRALIVWLIVVLLFLAITIGFGRYGRRVIFVAESKGSIMRSLDLEAQNKVEEAIAGYKKAVQIDAKSLRPRMLLARALMRIGRFDEAKTAATEAVEVVVPEDQASALTLLGQVCAEMGAWAEAQAAFERALAAGPQNGEAHYGLAKIAEATGTYGRMIEELTSVAALGSAKASPEYEAERTRHNQAVSQLLAQLKTQGDSGELLYRLGVEYKELGKWPEALAAFGKAVASANAPADAQFWLGAEAETKGDFAAAVQAYRQVVEKAPNHVAALNGISRCTAAGSRPK